jgi:Zn-dependent peptidase ImmA (M78 family)/DNA-binding XRE family transcriptional regulator
MRPGTPGFSGARLREAREARGLSVVSLADIAGVSSQAIYQYEKKGGNSPGPEVLSKIAAGMNLPEAFFLQPERTRPETTVYYRSLSSATKTARRRADSRLRWVQDLVAYVEEYVALPELNVPTFELPDDPRLISDADIEQVADALRRYWRLGEGPIANMVLLLENQGIVVARGPLGAEALDGVSTHDGERPFIFIGTDKGTPVRWRFDAAHELGHVLLHYNIAQEHFQHPELHKRIEQQAHRFASSFLLPLAPFGEDLFAANLDVFRSLKPKWKTSIAMMIMQAKYGDYISDDMERKLWITMSRRKWRTNEPLDDTMEPEVPRLLRRSIELILDEGAQTADDIVNRLQLSRVDVESLTGLPEGFLSNHSRVSLLGKQDSNVVSLSDRRRDG